MAAAGLHEFAIHCVFNMGQVSTVHLLRCCTARTNCPLLRDGAVRLHGVSSICLVAYDDSDLGCIFDLCFCPLQRCSCLPIW